MNDYVQNIEKFIQSSHLQTLLSRFSKQRSCRQQDSDGDSHENIEVFSKMSESEYQFEFIHIYTLKLSESETAEVFFRLFRDRFFA